MELKQRNRQPAGIEVLEQRLVQRRSGIERAGRDGEGGDAGRRETVGCEQSRQAAAVGEAEGVDAACVDGVGVLEMCD